MTIDKSLRVKRGATRNRSVLTRVERITRLREADRWKEGDSPLGLAKVRVRINDMVFVDYLSYHKVNGAWLITSKAYHRET